MLNKKFNIITKGEINMELRKILADNVKFYRSQLKISQEKLAERCNLSTNYVGSIESRARRVNIDTIEKLAKGLQIDPSELLVKRKLNK